MLERLLGEPGPAPQRVRLGTCAREATILLGTIALCAGADRRIQELSFAAGWARLPIPGGQPAVPQAPDCLPELLGPALDRLAGLDAAGKRALTDACAHTVAADGSINPREAELLRLTCLLFGVPLPAFADTAE
jgi:hypothetical protein